uniref:Major sperm protein n=1 Tax=Panagrellus redivivus TaxID=6233 RepID=A0A7E4W5T7_PANRE
MDVSSVRRVCVIVNKNARSTASHKFHYKADGLIEIVRVPFTAMPRSIWDVLPLPLPKPNEPAWIKPILSGSKKRRHNMYQLNPVANHEEIIILIPRVVSKTMRTRRRIRDSPRLLTFKINHNGNQIVLATLSVASNDPEKANPRKRQVTMFTKATLCSKLCSVEPYIVPEPMLAATAIAYEADAQVAPIVRQLNPNALHA